MNTKKIKTIKSIALILSLMLAISMAAFTLTACDNNCSDCSACVCTVSIPCTCAAGGVAMPCTCATIPSACTCGAIPAPCGCTPPDATMPCGCASSVLPTTYTELMRYMRHITTVNRFSVSMTQRRANETGDNGEVIIHGRNNNYIFASWEYDGESETAFLLYDDGAYYEVWHDGDEWLQLETTDEWDIFDFYGIGNMAAGLAISIIENINRFYYANGTFNLRRGMFLIHFIQSPFWLGELVTVTITVRLNGNVLIEVSEDLGQNARIYTFYINIANPVIPPLPNARVIEPQAIGIWGDVLCFEQSDWISLEMGQANTVRAYMHSEFGIGLGTLGLGAFDGRFTIELSGDVAIVPVGTFSGTFNDQVWRAFYFENAGTVTLTAISVADPTIYLVVDISVHLPSVFSFGLGIM